MWSRRPMPERSASTDSSPGRVSGCTRWPASSRTGVTRCHEDASSQNPGMRMTSMPRRYRRAADTAAGRRRSARRGTQCERSAVTVRGARRTPAGREHHDADGEHDEPDDGARGERLAEHGDAEDPGGQRLGERERRHGRRARVRAARCRTARTRAWWRRGRARAPWRVPGPVASHAASVGSEHGEAHDRRERRTARPCCRSGSSPRSSSALAASV